jgi:23S rRNA-/tRNA-specific pseudouridylate synthase
LSPAHRLDRLTAGVLLFTVRREVRGAYQSLFAAGLVAKTYLARAGTDPQLSFPLTVRSRIVKRRGCLQAVEEPGEPNAETIVEHVGAGRYRLTPQTGRRWACRSSVIRSTRGFSMSPPTTSRRLCSCWRTRWRSMTRSPGLAGRSPVAGR